MCTDNASASYLLTCLPTLRTQCYTYWRAMFNECRGIQGRIHDTNLLLASHAARDDTGACTPEACQLLCYALAHSRTHETYQHVRTYMFTSRDRNHYALLSTCLYVPTHPLLMCTTLPRTTYLRTNLPTHCLPAHLLTCVSQARELLTSVARECRLAHALFWASRDRSLSVHTPPQSRL